MQILRLKRLLKEGEACHFAAITISSTQPTTSHRHDFHEIFWIEEGEGSHWINGEQRELKAGALILIRAPDAHCFSAVSGGSFRMVNVAFACRTWEYLRRRYYSAERDFFGLRSIRDREYQLSLVALNEIRQVAQELAIGSRRLSGIERFLVNIIYLLGLNQLPFETAKGVNVPEWLSRACRGITQPQHLVGGTRAFARLAGRSPEHVTRETRRFLETTPTEIVNRARMDFAASRLAGTNDSIFGISLDCGFQNLGHFYSLFRKRFGMTPRLYRLRQQQIISPLSIKRT